MKVQVDMAKLVCVFVV